MRVFVCEYVTGGGMRGEALPASLAREGAMMRDAVLADLARLPGLDIVTTHDGRLDPPPLGASRPISAADDPWDAWRRCIAACDVAWPIAPETGGALARLTRLIEAPGAALIGPDSGTVAVAASKRATAQLLLASGVPAIPTYAAGEARRRIRGPAVSKPDDGAGCVDTFCWPDAAAIPEAAGTVVQPFVAGTPASLSVLCWDGVATVLAANRQHIALTEGRFRFGGVTVGAIRDHGDLSRLAGDVLRAMPGLRGIVGIDIILTPEGPVVVEVNPRLTTSYAGLHAALGENPAALLPPFGGSSAGAAGGKRMAVSLRVAPSPDPI